MDHNISSNNLDLQFYFVYKGDIKEVSEELLYSYESCKQYFETESIQWILENDCLLLELDQLTKRNIFILESFEGNVFNYLSKSKSLILGPKCLISCITDDKTVPLTNTAVFNTAMMDMHVCTSGVNIGEKEKIKKLVNWMGGHFSEILYKGCTHLVSNTVKSSKYEKAALSGIKIMHPDWVKDVWTRCIDKYILASNKEFDKHKLPIFYALNITTTGLSVVLRAEINKLVTENGGKIIGAFKSDLTDILILEKTTKDSRKYQAAVKYKKECLTPQWIIDSVEKGFAQAVQSYTVRSLKASTPTKGIANSVSDFNPDCTALSEISYVNQAKDSTINDTISSGSSTRSGFVSLYKNKLPAVSERKYSKIIKNLSLAELRKSESFLDGCSVYLCGFIQSEKEKLHKIINSGCATRYDELNEKITHIIMGEPTDSEIRTIKKHNYCPMYVTLEWLLECIKEKQPVEENNFLYKSSGLKSPNEPLLASPATQKNIDSMNKCFKRPPIPKFKLDEMLNKEKEREEQANDLLAQYLQPNKQDEPNNLSEMSNDVGTSSCSNECTENVVCFLKDMDIYVHSVFDEETYKDVVTDCKSAGGEVVDENYKSKVDYIIVPITGVSKLEMPMDAKHIVNDLWLDDSIEKEEIVNIQYFHEAIVLEGLDNPLNEMMIVLSTYSTSERDFLVTLSKSLGATIDNVYERKKKPLLICPLPEGAKYEAALKWGFPVVTCKWLLECYRLKKRLPLKDFLLGDSVAPEDDIVLEKSLTENKVADSSLNKSGKSDKSGKSSEVSDDEPEINDENAEELSSPKWRQYVSNLCDKDDILSQQLMDNIEKSNNNSLIQSDKLYRHRRLSDLIDNENTPKSLALGSPKTPLMSPTTSSHNISDLVLEFPTPQRPHLYKALKKMEDKDTPQTKRLKKLIATSEKSPKTPVIPEKFKITNNPSEKRIQAVKRRMDALSDYYMPITKKAAPDTPSFKEIRNNYWRQYFDIPYDGNEVKDSTNTDKNASTTTQFIAVDKISNLCETAINNFPLSNNDDDANSIPSSTIRKSIKAESNVDSKKFQRLSDFINKRDESIIKNQEQQHHAEIDTTYESAVSEPQIPSDNPIIEYGDPSEFNMRRNKIYSAPLRKFSISCSNDYKRAQMIEAIQKLNGEVCGDFTKFDKTCTHLLCEKPNRGEKTLASIASGKWILCLNYIQDSIAADAFLNEENYEWGNPKATKHLPKLNPNDEAIAKAAHRWRLQVVSEQCGTFKGFRVLLHSTNNKVFSRLISAGSGHVIDVEAPYAESEDAMTATHCFVEQNKMQLDKKDHKVLAEAGVQILSMSYLNAYLTSENKPDTANYKVNI